MVVGYIGRLDQDLTRIQRPQNLNKPLVYSTEIKKK